MKIVYTIIFFMFGTIFGSFYNVVAFRLSKGNSIVKPRSHCMKCNHELSPLDLVPILSYLFLKGRCRYCKEKISIFYPTMEFITGCLFALSFYSFGFTYDVLLAIALSSLFVIVTVTDLNYLIIPDEINIAFPIIIFIINIFRLGFFEACTYVVYGIIIFLFMYLLMMLGNLIFKEESLGGGDIKLMLALGMCFPVLISVLGITLAAFLALPVSLIIYFTLKDKSIPFGPFLVLGFLLLFFIRIDSKDILNFIMNI